MKLHVLWPFAFGIVVMLSMNSCTKTITEPGTVDTLRDTIGAGHAWVRFVSMFPDSVTTTLWLSTTPNPNTSLYTFASNSCSGEFLPVRSDSSYRFYVTIPSMPGWSDSIFLPALGNTMNTWALFLGHDQQGNISVQTGRSVDSEYLTPPPAGYCYLRFINGVPDGAAQFDFDLDTVYNSVFKLDGQPQLIVNGYFSRYALVKAGQHTILLRTPGTSETPLEAVASFQEGFYYTARATGSLFAKNAKLTIDRE